LREALRRAPDDINARRLYGNALLAVDAPEQAAEQFRQVLAVEPQDTRALNALGVSLDLQGEHEEAQRVYRSALELKPDHLPLRNNLALSIALTGDAEQALAMLQDLAGLPSASKAPQDPLHHQQVQENILMVLALSDDVAGMAPGRRFEANPATRKPPSLDRLLAMARLTALASALVPAAGVTTVSAAEVTAETPVAAYPTNRLDWSSIENVVRNGAEPMNINWLDPHIPLIGGRWEPSSVRHRNPGIAPLIAQQRRSLPAGVDARDAADNNQVIAADVCGHDGAFEADKTSLQQFAAVFACPVGDFGELAFASGGKRLRHVVLTFGEDIDRDGPVARIGIQAGGVQPKAEKYERGVERQRAERTDRDADGTAIRVEGGDDRHSGGKATEGIPETMCIDHSSSFCH
jgi:hypothetical protein